MLNVKIKKILAGTLSVLLLITIAFYSYRLSRPETSTYIGSSDSVYTSQATNTKVETVTDSSGQTKSVSVANDPSFEPRTMTGGGDKPLGWLMSVTESQPNVFTGKLLYKEGTETYSLFLQEAAGFFTGEAKSAKDKSVKDFSMQRQNTLCKDAEGNTYEYTFIASFDGTNLNGCGGTVLEVKK
jgi:hypothetical protein